MADTILAILALLIAIALLGALGKLADWFLTTENYWEDE